MTRWYIGSILFLLSLSNVQAGLVKFAPSSNPVGPGNFILQLIGEDFIDATIGGGVDLIFDPTLINVSSVIFDNSVFDFQKTVRNIDNDIGRIESILVSSINSEHSGTFNIATIVFMALGTGDTLFDLEPSTFPTPWLTASGADIAPTFQDSSLQVIPIPTAVWLFITGLGFLGTICKKKSKNI